MDKQFLLSIIDKYYLNGLVEKAKWSIKNKEIQINLLSANRDLVGTITSPSFEMDDKDIAIYDTTQLIKLIGITNNFITLSCKEEGLTPVKLLIDDTEYNLEYSLADAFIIPKQPKIDEPVYDFEFNIDKDLIDKFIKSKKALDSDSTSIQGVTNKKGNYVEFILGDNSKHANKVKFNYPIVILESNSDKLFLDSNNIKEIFVSNKDLVQGKCHFSNQGLIKFVFENEAKQKSIYYLVAKS